MVIQGFYTINGPYLQSLKNAFYVQYNETMVCVSFIIIIIRVRVRVRPTNFFTLLNRNFSITKPSTVLLQVSIIIAIMLSVLFFHN